MTKPFPKKSATFRPRLVTLEDRTTPTAAFALTATSLIGFDTATPDVQTTTAITGVVAGDSLVGIDYRPQNGALYGLGLNSAANSLQLYGISGRTGTATPIGTSFALSDATGTLITIAAGTNFGLDFNPVVDRLRVVTDSGLNFRVNPNNGLPNDTDNSVAGNQPDSKISGSTTVVDAAAYTNNAPNATFTTLYALDATTDKLSIQNPPNNGTQTLPLAITLAGSPLNFSAVNGFDIGTGVDATASNAAVVSGKGLAILSVGGATSLFAIDLVTGVATKAGTTGFASPVLGLAVNPLDRVGTPLIGVAGANLLRFNSNTPNTTTSAAITGLAATETVVGLDIRPATGQYFVLVLDSTTKAVRLANIDPQSGATTPVGVGTISLVDGAGSAITFGSNTSFGIDFNPTVDRLRVVTSTGFNFRINPNNGTAVDGDFGGAAGSVMDVNPDKSANGGSTTVDGTAYTNSFAGTKFTTQYTIDSTTGKLFIQTLPNSGTQTVGTTITVAGVPLIFTAVNGFDIPASVQAKASNTAVNGSGFAALTSGGTTSLYSINLASGAATKLGPIGTGTIALSGLSASDAITPTSPAGEYAVGSETGVATVRVYNSDSSVKFEAMPFGTTFAGGIRVALADFNGDGVNDVAVGTGPGTITDVRILDGTTQAELFRVQPFEAAFTGGIYLAAGDVTGDGVAELLVTPDQGGGPRVRIFNGVGFAVAADFFGINDVNFRGGARAAVGDVNGDGIGDVVVAAGFGGGPRVATYDGKTIGSSSPTTLFNDFFVFEQTLRNGVFIAAGDINGDGKADIIAGGGPGGGPRVFALSGADLVASNAQTTVANFFAGDAASRGGVRVVAKNLDGDIRSDLIIGAGTGSGSRVRGYLGTNLGNANPAEFFSLDTIASSSGVYVG